MSENNELPAPAPSTLPSTHPDRVAAARLRRDQEAAATQLAMLDILGRQLAAMSRAPFRALLKELIGAAPTPEAIRAFADKYPDRWAQATSIMAGLAGFERGVVEVNVFNIKGLSDSELMRRMEEVEGQLREAKRPKAVGEVPPPTDAEIVTTTVRAKVVADQVVAVGSESPAAFGGGRLDQLDRPAEV